MQNYDLGSFNMTTISWDTDAHIYLKELNTVPIEYRDNKIENNGFYEDIFHETIKDT